MWNKRGVKTQGSVWAQQGEAKIIIFSSSSKKETCGGGWAGLITFVLTMLSQTKEAQSLSAPWQFDSPQSSSGLGTVHLSVQLGITATSNCGAWNDNMPVKWDQELSSYHSLPKHKLNWQCTHYHSQFLREKGRGFFHKAALHSHFCCWLNVRTEILLAPKQLAEAWKHRRSSAALMHVCSANPITYWTLHMYHTSEWQLDAWASPPDTRREIKHVLLQSQNCKMQRSHGFTPDCSKKIKIKTTHTHAMLS